MSTPSATNGSVGRQSLRPLTPRQCGETTGRPMAQCTKTATARRCLPCAQVLWAVLLGLGAALLVYRPGLGSAGLLLRPICLWHPLLASFRLHASSKNKYVNIRRPHLRCRL